MYVVKHIDYLFVFKDTFQQNIYKFSPNTNTNEIFRFNLQIKHIEDISYYIYMQIIIKTQFSA